MDHSTLSRLTAGSQRSSVFRRLGVRLPELPAPHLDFEPFRILGRVDSTKRFELPLDPTFPLAVKLYEFPQEPCTVPMTWHERLEIFCPLGGPGAFRVGEHLEHFDAGDILLIDNLRLHGVERFDGDPPHALVVVFYPVLLAAPGSLPCDLLLLRPFRNFRDGSLRLPRECPHSDRAWECLNWLVLAQAGNPDDPAMQARQKLALSELLLVLEEAFRDRVSESSNYEQRRDRLRRLSPLLDFIGANLTEPLHVSAAARMLRMSNSYFMRFFRAATGLTFSAYVSHLRTSRACQLLMETDLSLAEIAAETGFCDQSHLCRHIRRRLGKSPRQVRIQRRITGSTLPLEPGG